MEQLPFFLAQHAAELDKLQKDLVLVYGKPRAHAAWRTASTLFMAFQLESMMKQEALRPVWESHRADLLKLGLQVWLTIEGADLEADGITDKSREVTRLFGEVVQSIVTKMTDVRGLVVGQLKSMGGLGHDHG